MNTKKTIIISIVIIVLALGGFFYYSGGSMSSDSSLVSNQTSSTDQATGARVLALLSQINSINIDPSIFANPIFKTLRDYTVDIPEQGVGRDNPFSPIPGVPTPGSQPASAPSIH